MSSHLRVGWVLCLSAMLPACLSFQRGALRGAPPDSTFVHVDGVRMRYTDEGSGPTVVLVHGFNSSLEVWEGVRAELADRYRVIAIDQRGFGFSDRPEGAYDPQTQAQFVRGVLDQLGVERFDLVAHSWGASVAMALTLQEPDRVRRMALYSAWIYDEQLTAYIRWSKARGVGEVLAALYFAERWTERLEFAFHDPNRLTQEMVDRVQSGVEREGSAAVAVAVMRGQDFTPLEARYGDVRIPVLIVWGENDRIAHVSAGQRLERDLPNARLSVYPACGHYPMLEAPRSIHALGAFLDEGR